MKSENNQRECPFWVVEMESESDAKKLASRSVSIRSILQLWSHGKSFNIFHENLKLHLNENKLNYAQYFEKTRDFKIIVETYNKHFLQDEKVQKIETLDYIPFTAKVNLKNPSLKFLYIEFYGLDPNDVPDEPLDVLFGRWISDGQRDVIQKISLKTRKFIGNTSMDPTLSILMANQALVRPGDLVLDPFVGTGSLLVSTAIFGGYVFGSDIDFMMLHGKTRPSRIKQKKREHDESVYSNLVQYGCPSQYLDVFVSDFSKSPWREEIQFDSIISDPPYGIREATEKVKSSVEKPVVMAENEDLPHYPATCSYNLFQLFYDLISFSAKHLRTGGRLVFWIPFYRADYKEELIPKHQSMRLIANSEQILSGFVCRRLLTYEKVNEKQGDLELNSTTVKYDFNFRERYFNPTDLSRKERRQIKYDQNKRPDQNKS